MTGYVKAEYCVTGEDAIELAKKVGTRVATVTTTTLKVRESASTSAPVLGLVPIDEELSVLEESDGWVKVDRGRLRICFLRLRFSENRFCEGRVQGRGSCKTEEGRGR